MTRSLTKRSFVALAASATLVLAACGSDDDAASTTDAPADTEAPAATEAPADTEAPAATEAPADTAAPADDVDREGWPEKLVFTLTPSQETGGLIETAQPLADMLGERLG
ncbi:MAG: phosphonate transport system substrate-binding protein, partial [Ilumatobacter sp.]